MILLVYLWRCEEFGHVDHLCDFQLNEFRQNRDTGESIYQQFKVGSCISIPINMSVTLTLK